VRRCSHLGLIGVDLVVPKRMSKGKIRGKEGGGEGRKRVCRFPIAFTLLCFKALRAPYRRRWKQVEERKGEKENSSREKKEKRGEEGEEGACEKFLIHFVLTIRCVTWLPYVVGPRKGGKRKKKGIRAKKEKRGREKSSKISTSSLSFLSSARQHHLVSPTYPHQRREGGGEKKKKGREEKETLAGLSILFLAISRATTPKKRKRRERKKTLEEKKS